MSNSTILKNILLFRLLNTVNLIRTMQAATDKLNEEISGIVALLGNNEQLNLFDNPPKGAGPQGAGSQDDHIRNL